MKTRPEFSDLSTASDEQTARQLWPSAKDGNGLDPLRTHAVAAAVAAAIGRSLLLADILDSAAASGIARTPIEEALLQVYLFAGYPRAIEALSVMANRWPRGEVATGVPPEDWPDAGVNLCRKVYGRNFEKLHDNIGICHPDLRDWMIVEGYGKVLSRPGLDSISRELCTVGALTAMHAPRQLQAHILGARNVGATRAQIARAVELGALGCGEQTWQNAYTLFLEIMGTA